MRLAAVARSSTGVAPTCRGAALAPSVVTRFCARWTDEGLVLVWRRHRGPARWSMGRLACATCPDGAPASSHQAWFAIDAVARTTAMVP